MNKKSQIIKASVVAVALLLIISIVFLIVGNLRFHLTGVNPNLSSVANISPFLEVEFNKSLANKISIDDNSHIVKNYDIQNKTLFINLNTPLKLGQKYVINIASVRDIKGALLTNIKLDFSPKNIEFQNLPKDQQAKILSNQAAYKNTNNNIVFANTDALINNGMSATQLSLLEQYFKDFNSTAKKITIDSNSVGVYAGTPPAVAMFRFNVNVDSKDYKANANYTFLNNISLELYDVNGNLIFNSQGSSGE